MNHTSTRRNKKIKNLLAILIGIVLLLGSTYAWRDLSQHKTNPWGDLRDPNIRNVTLNDEFPPPAELVTDEPVSKKVSVSNLDDSGGDVCVRLAVREFMQLRISDTGIYYTEIKDDPESPVLLFATFANNDYATLGYPQGSYLPYSLLSSTDPAFATLVQQKFQYGESYPIPTGVDGDGEPTFETYATTNIKELRNGIYGKPMPVVGDVLQKWGTAVFAQPTHRARPDVPSGECNYNPFLWGTSKGIAPTMPAGNLAADDNMMRTYMTLTGKGMSEMVSMADWKKPTTSGGKGGALGDFWVYDTDGYVYWGNRLKIGETTNNLLESAQFKSDPGERSSDANGNNNTVNNPKDHPVKLDYFMHIDMDATDETETEILAVFSHVENATWQDLVDMVEADTYSADKLAFLAKLAGVTLPDPS